MIARTWHGRVRTAKADEYETFLERTGLADYATMPGYRGVLMPMSSRSPFRRRSGGSGR